MNRRAKRALVGRLRRLLQEPIANVDAQNSFDVAIEFEPPPDVAPDVFLDSLAEWSMESESVRNGVATTASVFIEGVNDDGEQIRFSALAANIPGALFHASNDLLEGTNRYGALFIQRIVISGDR